MSIRLQSALVLAICCLAGVVLAVWVALGYYRHGEHRQLVGPDSVAQKQAEHLQEMSGQLLITADLVIGSGESFLADGSRAQCERAAAVADELGEFVLARDSAVVLSSIRASVLTIASCVEEAGAATGAGRDGTLARLLGELDASAANLLEDIDTLARELESAASQRLADLDRELAGLHSQAIIVGVAYLLVLMLAWRFQARTIVRPLTRLSSATTRARASGELLGVEPSGPRELRCLTAEISAFVDRMLTENQRIEAVVGERTEELVRANKTKDEFLAAMSHEIRTPLNGVIGILDVLDGDRLSATQHEMIGVAMQSAQHLLALISGVLDFAKMTSEKLQLEHLPTDLGKCTDEVVSALQHLAESKGIDLEVENAAGGSPTVFTDPVRIRQVLFNIVGNAVKYTARGSVRVVVEVGERDRNTVPIHVAVHDTGVGMTAEAIDRLFEAFVQADATVTRTHGGTGLGLAISDEIVRLMGGSITVDSEVGRGSVFHIWLELEPCSMSGAETTPLAVATDGGEAVARNLQEASQRALRAPILLVEDNVVNQLVARRMLERRGYRVDVVENGQECLDQVRTTAYDLVLMDLMMPVMDGLVATRRLRELESRGELADGTPRPLPIIALTANAQASDREDCLRAGMVDFLSKPFRSRDLCDVVGRALPDRD